MKNRFVPALAAPLLGLALATFATASHADYSTGFDGVSLPVGWLTTNVSTANVTGNPWSVGAGITDADGNIVVPPFAGDAFALVNYTSIGSGSGTINNWLISPEFATIKNGDTFSFYTTTTPESAYPDRLEFRLSTAGAGSSVGTTVTGVGTFTTLLTSVNPTLAAGGYPEDWTKVTVTMSGLAAPVDGRVAFRYYVTAGGPSGVNSNIIGVDSFSYVTAAVPEPETWGLMLAGLGALGWVAKRNKAAKQA